LAFIVFESVARCHPGRLNANIFGHLHQPQPGTTAAGASAAELVANNDYRIIRRNGAVVPFAPTKIAVAMTKAFLAVNGEQGRESARIRELVEAADQQRGRGPGAPPAERRHLPHRRCAGPGGAVPDALGRA
jgi:hypothetical protein